MPRSDSEEKPVGSQAPKDSSARLNGTVQSDPTGSMGNTTSKPALPHDDDTPQGEEDWRRRQVAQALTALAEKATKGVTFDALSTAEQTGLNMWTRILDQHKRLLNDDQQEQYQALKEKLGISSTYDNATDATTQLTFAITTRNEATYNIAQYMLGRFCGGGDDCKQAEKDERDRHRKARGDFLQHVRVPKQKPSFDTRWYLFWWLVVPSDTRVRRLVVVGAIARALQADGSTVKQSDDAAFEADQLPLNIDLGSLLYRGVLIPATILLLWDTPKALTMFIVAVSAVLAAVLAAVCFAVLVSCLPELDPCGQQSVISDKSLSTLYDFFCRSFLANIKQATVNLDDASKRACEKTSDASSRFFQQVRAVSTNYAARCAACFPIG